MTDQIEWLTANAGRGDIIIAGVALIAAVFAAVFLALAMRAR